MLYLQGIFISRQLQTVKLGQDRDKRNNVLINVVGSQYWLLLYFSSISLIHDIRVVL